ncbi:MAG TPA: hypothetical protein PKC55_06350 [Dysgonomonas sp.]|uniref:hypothetical protein n=1 Tax=unclassified Dysgonomonas TaxID=2630389 RepID=UPI0025C443EB|nr:MULTISPECIES: hypothetical protein [unclassified Dysgonomonas]HML64433.1 hypothetical protein [Dysgonomonas sp.]
MKKYLLCLVYLLFVSSSFSFEIKQKEDVSIFMDIDYKGSKLLYDEPGGHVVKKLKHDFVNEDFIVFNIINKNDSMFQVEAYYSIKGYIGKGWIKKDKHLGIYSRAYGSQPLRLYSKPSMKSRVVYTEGVSTSMYVVTDYHGQWLKVKISVGGKIHEGWMPWEMQCSNVYSTCC